jgi:transposase
MPFVIRPPLNSTAADDPSLTFTIIEPEPYERLILRDLKAWDWRIARHGFGDEDFITAMKQIEKDIKKRRRQTHAIGDELYGYNARRTLKQVWELEAERMLNEEAY